MQVQEVFYNVPTVLPYIVRWLAGWAVGTAGVLSEPALASLGESFSQV